MNLVNYMSMGLATFLLMYIYVRNNKDVDTSISACLSNLFFSLLIWPFILLYIIVPTIIAVFRGIHHFLNLKDK